MQYINICVSSFSSIWILLYKQVIISDEKAWKYDGASSDDFNVSDIKIELYTFMQNLDMTVLSCKVSCFA